MIIPKPPKGAAPPRGHAVRFVDDVTFRLPHGPPAGAGVDIGWGLSFLGRASRARG